MQSQVVRDFWTINSMTLRTLNHEQMKYLTFLEGDAELNLHLARLNPGFQGGQPLNHKQLSNEKKNLVDIQVFFGDEILPRYYI